MFRYQLGCNARGEYPTKFNGGNFTFDPSLVNKSRTYNPDWRAWGGGVFTAKNQRLVHWPMLKTGDADLLLPQFEFYRRALPDAVARVRTYWGHEGCLFTEQMENFALPMACAWGWTEANATARQRGLEIPFGDPRADGATKLQRRCRAWRPGQRRRRVPLGIAARILVHDLEYHRFFGADIRRVLADDPAIGAVLRRALSGL